MKSSNDVTAIATLRKTFLKTRGITVFIYVCVISWIKHVTVTLKLTYFELKVMVVTQNGRSKN